MQIDPLASLLWKYGEVGAVARVPRHAVMSVETARPTGGLISAVGATPAPVVCAAVEVPPKQGDGYGAIHDCGDKRPEPIEHGVLDLSVNRHVGAGETYRTQGELL